MHELGIISSVLKTIEGIMQEEQLTHVEKLVLEVGELSGIVPEFIEECFPAATYKTPFEDLKLEMEIVPGIARCGYCGEEFNVMKSGMKCPKCGAVDNMEALTGKDFMIKEIVAC